mmetsp:Transcript_59248/g.70696  ORF Transcript_59248/g.70696 Transcript_59248/m.70696 type:complete len:464 (-) Transcript_59248:94-1485(-)
MDSDRMDSDRMDSDRMDHDRMDPGSTDQNLRSNTQETPPREETRDFQPGNEPANLEAVEKAAATSSTTNPNETGGKFPEYAGFKNSWEPHEPTDHAVFWHIAKSGGTSFKEALSNCFKYVLASDVGIKGHENDKELAIVTDQYGNKYVNVDTTIIPGIKRAIQMDYVSSGLAQVTSTPYVVDIERAFSRQIKGRVFTIFRHPIERSVSLFNYLQYASWEPTYNPELSEMTLEQYARSSYMENNFLTRSLTNRWEGELNNGHLEEAMDFMRRKILVGLLTELDKSMTRFEKYFGWQFHESPLEQEVCREGMIRRGMNKNKKKTVVPEQDTIEYEVLAWENMYDMQIYNYAVQLFTEQEVLVKGIADDFRMSHKMQVPVPPPQPEQGQAFFQPPELEQGQVNMPPHLESEQEQINITPPQSEQEQGQVNIPPHLESEQERTNMMPPSGGPEEEENLRPPRRLRRE